MALQFSSTSQGVDLSTSAALGTRATFTLLGWFLATDNAAGNDFATPYDEALDSTGLLSVFLKQAGTINFSYRQVSGGNIVSITSAGTYDDSLWHWFQIVKRASNDYEVYIDGSSVGTATDDITAASAATSVRIGNSGGSQVLPSGSRVAFFRGFSEALTVEQGEAVMLGRLQRIATVFNLPLFGSGGSTEPDMSKNAFNGTVTGLTKADGPPQVKWYGTGRMTEPAHQGPRRYAMYFTG